jgi:tRNA pseudouridine13 synthase
MLTTEGLAYLTDDEPGIGGSIKGAAEDFVVEEINDTDFPESGEHLYLYVEKVHRLTTDVVRLFSQHFSVGWDDVGYAGLKDKHALTRQWFSIPRGKGQRAAEFEDSHIRILRVERHDQELLRGQLAGNRFEIKVRDVGPAAVLRARRILDRLVKSGAPNFIGEQRFGYRNNNHLQGRSLLIGDLQEFLDSLLGRPGKNEPRMNEEARRAYDAGDYRAALDFWPTVHRFERQALGPLSRGAPLADAVHGIDKPHLTLMVSAFQSAIFNRVLDDRLRRRFFDTLLEGDLALEFGSHRLIEVRDPAGEQPRADRLEVTATGPMWGRKMPLAGGKVGEWEREALHDAGMTEEILFRDGPYTPEGLRRPMRMRIKSPRVGAGSDERGPYVFVGFELPPGCFATVVLREIMKN